MIKPTITLSHACVYQRKVGHCQIHGTIYWLKYITVYIEMSFMGQIHGNWYWVGKWITHGSLRLPWLSISNRIILQWKKKCLKTKQHSCPHFFQFSWNSWSKWSTYELIIFTKFHEDRTINLDFLLMEKFWTYLVLFDSDFRVLKR